MTKAARKITENIKRLSLKMGLWINFPTAVINIAVSDV
jgi:hypothetical protein